MKTRTIIILFCFTLFLLPGCALLDDNNDFDTNGPEKSEHEEDVTKEQDLEEEKLYEVANQRGNTIGNSANDGLVAQQDDWVFYRVNGQIYKAKLDGSQKEKVTSPQEIERAQNINVVGEWIYFLDNRTTTEGSGFMSTTNVDCKLYKIKLDGSELTRLSDDDIFEINVIGDTIYYINYSDKERIYKMDVCGSNATQLNDDISLGINVVEDNIYYIVRKRHENCKIAMINTDGTNRDVISDASDNDMIMSLLYDDGYLYYGYHDKSFNSFVGRIDLDTGARKNILSDIGLFAHVFINDDVLYFRMYEKGLFKSNIDGSEQVNISIDDPISINVINDEWLFYTIGDSSVIMDTDGSNRTRLTQDSPFIEF